jgi:hypothetical protein
MKPLFKLVVGMLSLAVMLVGFVPSLARAQIAMVENINVSNNCEGQLGDSVTTAFSVEKTGPEERAEGTVSASLGDGSNVNTMIAEVILNYQWLATFEKGQGATVKEPYALSTDGEEFQYAGKTYQRIYGKTTHPVPFRNINARSTGLLTWKIDGAKNKTEWEADFNYLQGWTQIPGSEAIVVKITVNLTRNGGALGGCGSDYVPIPSDPGVALFCEEEYFNRFVSGTVVTLMTMRIAWRCAPKPSLTLILPLALRACPHSCPDVARGQGFGVNQNVQQAVLPGMVEPGVERCCEAESRQWTYDVTGLPMTLAIINTLGYKRDKGGAHGADFPKASDRHVVRRDECWCRLAFGESTGVGAIRIGLPIRVRCRERRC